jgi:hypothetical protein
MTEDMLIRNCMVVLQSCTNSPKVVVGLCSETGATSSCDGHEGVSIKVEEVTDMDVKVEEISVVKVEEDTVMDIKEEEIPVVRFEEKTAIDAKEEEIPMIKFDEPTDIDIKEEEIPVDVLVPTIKAEQDEVSYKYVCPFLGTFYQYPRILTVVISISLST